MADLKLFTTLSVSHPTLLYYSYSISMHILQYVVIKHDSKDTILLYQYYPHTAHNTRCHYRLCIYILYYHHAS